MDWKIWNGKKVFVKLVDGAVYSGNIIEVDDEDNFLIKDKFGQLVGFPADRIVKIKEESNGRT